MNLKILMVSTAVLVVGALMFEGRRNLNPSIEKVQNTLSFYQPKAKDSPSVVVANKGAQKQVIEGLASKEELEGRIHEIDLYMKNSNMIERLNDRNLDPATREEFFAAIQMKQSLINQLVEKEIAASKELLAGGGK